MGKSQDLYKKAKKIIPGGTQLLSKRPEMFLPGLWPAYYKKAKGCAVWDLDGYVYLDMSTMGIGSCILGYGDKDVDRQVIRAIKNGTMCTLNCPEEVELVKRLIQIHPWSHMARFTRSGGEAMAVAVRIARAHTGKDVVLFCGYHGWHDWYLAANLANNRALNGYLLPGLDPAGVPRALKGTSYPFGFNDIEGFLELFKKYKANIAAVVLEPLRHHRPEPEFVNTIRKVTQKNKVVLIVDEITSGFRFHLGGAHLVLGLIPDIAVFAKGISNGYPMGVVLGKRKIMSSAQDSFISSTYWTERIGPVAALAAIRKMKEMKIPAYLKSIGQKVQESWKVCAKKYGLAITIEGMPALGHFTFNHPSHLVLKTLFTQEMLERDFLATSAFYASFAHTQRIVSSYAVACDKAFEKVSAAAKSGKPERYLKGPVCHQGFKRLN